MYVVGHGLIKGALFICAGILLHRCQSVDEFDLRGRGGKMASLSILMLAGAWGLAGLPPFATYYGQQFIDHAAGEKHLAWLSAIAIFTEVLTAAAVLRVTGRIFLGWGPVREATSRGSSHIQMKSETKGGGHDHTPLFMWLPAAILLLLGMIVANFSPLRGRLQHEMDRFRDGPEYQSIVLENQSLTPSPVSFSPSPKLDWKQPVTLALVVLLAGFSLFPSILGRRANQRLGHWIVQVMGHLRTYQSGRLGDYVAWLVFGIAACEVLLLLLRN
jgi:multicomponent Na+:H+ antiporter subunit D